mgnify:CR=1 FL=1
MSRLFGTDGVRGVANVDLTSELALQIGRAAAMVLLKESKSAKPTVLIGKDTRASGDMLEAALTAGLCSVGCNVLSVGIVPTPAVAYLVDKYGCEAGVMISASHNPCEYNGIKIFQGNGYKLDDALENEIEATKKALESNDTEAIKEATEAFVSVQTHCNFQRKRKRRKSQRSHRLETLREGQTRVSPYA